MRLFCTGIVLCLLALGGCEKEGGLRTSSNVLSRGYLLVHKVLYFTNDFKKRFKFE